MRIYQWGLIAACVLGSLACGQVLAQTHLPNVLYIYADDLGYGELGSYGQTKIRTPVLDQLAGSGMRFTQHYAGSVVCAPSRCVLLTGKHAGHASIRNTAYEEGTGFQLPLPAAEVTIGEVMKQAGYVTGAIGKWGLGGPGVGHPNNQGFDYFFGFLSQEHAHWYYPGYLYRNFTQVFYPQNNGVQGPSNNGTVHAQDEMTREALQFINDHATEPFYLHLAFTLPHISLQPPPHSDPAQAALGRTAIEEFYSDVTWPEPNANYAGDGYHAGAAQPRRAYAAMITAMDRDVGLILDRLDQLGLADNTLVIFASDNGPAFLGGVDYEFFNSTGGLRGLKGDLHEGGIRMPMIARWPNKIPAGTVSDHLCAQWDVLPTLAEVAGVPHPSNIDGLSFLPTLLGQPAKQAQHPYLYWEYHWGERVIRKGPWKGIRLAGPVVAGGRFELFNVATDPGELTNLSASNPALVAEMNDLMDISHTTSYPFFRFWDEFTNYGNVYFLPVDLGFQMTSTQAWTQAESAIVALPETVAGDVHFSLQIQMRPVFLKFLTGGLLIGNGPSPANMVFVGMRGSAKRYVIERGGQTAFLPFPAETDPQRIFNLEINYSPSTGLLQLHEGGQTLSMTLNPPIPAITHVGYGIGDSTTRFSPVVVTVADNVSVKLVSPQIEAGVLHATYQRPRPGPTSVFQYECSPDAVAWTPCVPSFEQPTDLFGQRQRIDVQFSDPTSVPMLYRVNHVSPAP